VESRSEKGDTPHCVSVSADPAGSAAAAADDAEIAGAGCATRKSRGSVVVDEHGLSAGETARKIRAPGVKMTAFPLVAGPQYVPPGVVASAGGLDTDTSVPLGTFVRREDARRLSAVVICATTSGGDPPVGRFASGGSFHDALNPGGGVRTDAAPFALVDASALLRALRRVIAVAGGIKGPAEKITALAAEAMLLASAADTAAGGVLPLWRAARERSERTVAADAKTAGSFDAAPLPAMAEPRLDAILDRALATLPIAPGVLLNSPALDSTAFVRSLLNAADCATAALSELADAPACVKEFAVVTNEATSTALAFADGSGASALLQTHDADGVDENEIDCVGVRDTVDDGDAVDVVVIEGVFDGDTPSVSVIVGDAETVDVGVGETETVVVVVDDAVRNDGVLLDDRDAETGDGGALEVGVGERDGVVVALDVGDAVRVGVTELVVDLVGDDDADFVLVGVCDGVTDAEREGVLVCDGVGVADDVPVALADEVHEDSRVTRADTDSAALPVAVPEATAGAVEEALAEANTEAAPVALEDAVSDSA
jgi:hypothetical protein